MKAFFGPGGNSEAFKLAGGKSTLDAPRWLSEIGLDAYAVASSPRKYSTWLYNSTREPLARVKDFIKYSF